MLEKAQLSESFSALSAKYRAMFKIQQDFDKLTTTITSELRPATMREMLMKDKIMELYVQQGKTHDQARYQMHIDAQEWDGLSDHLSQPHIVQQFIQAQEKRQDLKNTAEKNGHKNVKK